MAMNDTVFQWDTDTVFVMVMACMIVSMLCWLVSWAIGMPVVGILFVVSAITEMLCLMAMA